MAKIVSANEKSFGKAKLYYPPTYDPNIAYIWNPEDDFVLDGNEFGILFQTLKIQSHSNTELTPKQKVDAYNVLERVLKLAVEKEIAKPAPKPMNEADNPVKGSILPLDLPRL